MGIVIRRALHQQEGEKIKSTTMPIDLQKGTVSEQQDNQFDAYPYNGYHKSTISDYLMGRNGSPYSRQYNVDGQILSCGINWYDSLVQRLDMMIQATGEPVTLWRRKWTGETCPKCYNDRLQRGNARCPICVGTGFVGGFVQFINTRESTGRIYIRIGPTEEDLVNETTGLHQVFRPASWTLPTPIVRDRDLVIRYDPKTGEETWRYEILNVTRNKGFFNVPTVQNFTLARLDKTSPFYRLDWVTLGNNSVGQLAGHHDAADKLQVQIDNRFGDSFGDQGFSQGYKDGFIKGAADGRINQDYIDIPDKNVAGCVDTPYGLGIDNPIDKEAYLLGFQAGYKDGFGEGMNARRNDGYFVWENPRFLGDPNNGVESLDDYDVRERHPEEWKP